MRRLLLVVPFVLALVLVPLTQASARNDTAAHQCQGSGWTALFRADGTTFASSGECVSYAARGGALRTTPPASLLVDDRQYFCGGTCFGDVTGSGLAPGSDVDVFASGQLIGTGRATPDGTFSAPVELSCGFDWHDVHATGTTADGDPIESNAVDSPCG